MRSIVPVLAMAVMVLSGAVRAEETPAGYVVAVTLAGEDASAKTAVVRQGKELPAKLMMPVFAGDVVFLRDAASRIALELGQGNTVEVGGSLARYNVEGEIPTGDDAWSIFKAIGTVLAGDGEEIPENMAAKGDEAELKMPLAVHGANFIVVGERNLWLAWTGGKAPFLVTLTQDGKETVLPKSDSREANISVKPGKRFSVAIADAGHQVVPVRFRMRDSLPSMPEELRKAAPGPAADALILSAWLLTQDDGAWAVEAAQALHTRAPADQAAAALLERVIAGWKPE